MISRTDLISPRFSGDVIDTSFVSNQVIAKVRNEVSDKLLNTYRLVSEDCVCGESQGIVISQTDRYGLPLSSVLCSNCGTVRINPYPDVASIADFYTNHYQTMYGRSLNVEQYFDRQKQYGKKILRESAQQLKRGDVVVEIGCGAGGALSIFQESGYRVGGCDFDNRLLEFGRSSGINDVFYGSVNAIPVSFFGKAVFIYSNHVFEHVADPIDHLNSIKKLLAPDGKIVIVVPDLFGARQDDSYHGNILGMLHIAHKYNYTMAGLHAIAKRVGLTVKRIFPQSNLVTPTSNMGEIWVEMRAQMKIVDTVEKPDVDSLVRKLQAHEDVYQQRLRSSRGARGLIHRIIRLLKNKLKR